MKMITPCLWFNNQAEEAAQFYVSIFSKYDFNSKIKSITLYGKEGFEIHGGKEGTVMLVDFELAGQPYTALNGGPLFTFNEAVSLQVLCDTQEEIDYFWEKLSEGGDPNAQQCGWLKDKFGVSWQIVPTVLAEFTKKSHGVIPDKVMRVVLDSKKPIIEDLYNAYKQAV